MHAESGVKGVGTPIGAPTWPPCVAVSAGRAQVSGAHQPTVLASQPTSGPGREASTVPPPVTRQPASARAASLLKLRVRALLEACRRRVHRAHGPEPTQGYTDNAQEYPRHRASSAASSRRHIPPGRLACNGMWYVVLPRLVLTVAAA